MKSKELSKDLLKNKEFRKILKEYFSKDILDIIVFGSFMKGKENPNDIDMLIIFPKKVNLDLEYELRKDLSKLNFKFHVQGVSYKELFEAGFLAREGVISEGFSLLIEKPISECYGFLSYVLFKYNLEGMNASKKMMFYYSLFGRGKEQGVLQVYKSQKLSDNLIIVPVNNSENIRDFLDSKKIRYKSVNVLFSSIINKFLEK